MITLVTDAVLSNRLRGIYRSLLTRNQAKARELVMDMVYTMQNTDQVEIDMDAELACQAITSLYLALIHIAVHKYTHAHDIIRDLHFSIEARYHSL